VSSSPKEFEGLGHLMVFRSSESKKEAQGYESEDRESVEKSRMEGLLEKVLPIK
jgi:hypothetical protein